MEDKQFRKLLKLIEGTDDDYKIFEEILKKQKLTNTNLGDLDCFFSYHSNNSRTRSNIVTGRLSNLWSSPRYKNFCIRWYNKWQNGELE